MKTISGLNSHHNKFSNIFSSDEKNWHTGPLKTLSLQANRMHVFIIIMFINRVNYAGQQWPCKEKA